MLRRSFCAFMALMCLFLSAPACAVTSEKPVRLHILAENDTPDAQALKLELRDVCLRCAEVCLADVSSGDMAYQRLQAHLNDLTLACVRRARELGYMGNIHLEMGNFDFPNRVYGQILLPAGEYPALRVSIGAGEGHNWWCVLYPSLCALDESAIESIHVLSWLRSRLKGGKTA